MAPHYSTWKIDDEVDLRLTKEGGGAQPPLTVPQMFKKTVDKFGDKSALFFKDVAEVSVCDGDEGS